MSLEKKFSQAVRKILMPAVFMNLIFSQVYAQSELHCSKEVNDFLKKNNYPSFLGMQSARTSAENQAGQFEDALLKEPTRSAYIEQLEFEKVQLENAVATLHKGGSIKFLDVRAAERSLAFVIEKLKKIKVTATEAADAPTGGSVSNVAGEDLSALKQKEKDLNYSLKLFRSGAKIKGLEVKQVERDLSDVMEKIRNYQEPATVTATQDNDSASGASDKAPPPTPEQVERALKKLRAKHDMNNLEGFMIHSLHGNFSKTYYLPSQQNQKVKIFVEGSRIVGFKLMGQKQGPKKYFLQENQMVVLNDSCHLEKLYSQKTYGKESKVPKKFSKAVELSIQELDSKFCESRDHLRKISDSAKAGEFSDEQKDQFGKAYKSYFVEYSYEEVTDSLDNCSKFAEFTRMPSAQKFEGAEGTN